MPSLYDLSQEYVYLKSQLDDAESQDQYDAALEEAFDKIQDDLSSKGENIGRLVRMLNAEMEACEVEIKRLQTMKKNKWHAIERLKNIVHFSLESVGATELHTKIGKWKIAQNPPSVEVTDEAAIPEEYLIPQPPKVDKHKILDAFKETGEIVPGVEVVRKESVRFR